MIDRLDVIFCAPLGGWYAFDAEGKSYANPELQYLIMNNLWKVLSPDSGVLLIVLPNNNYTHQWVEDMKKVGIEVINDDYALKIVKHRDSPRNLPRISTKSKVLVH